MNQALEFSSKMPQSLAEQSLRIIHIFALEKSIHLEKKIEVRTFF